MKKISIKLIAGLILSIVFVAAGFGEIVALKGKDTATTKNTSKKPKESLVSYLRVKGNQATFVLINCGKQKLKIDKTLNSDFLTKNKGKLKVIDSVYGSDLNAKVPKEITESIIEGKLDFAIEPYGIIILVMEAS